MKYDINDLIKEHQSNLIWHLQGKMSLSRDDAEEIVMDTFMKVNSQLHKFEVRCSIGSWIYRIAINGAIDFIRKEKSKSNQVNMVRMSDDPFKYIAISDCSYVEQEIETERNKFIRNTIKSLPPIYREVMYLKYYKHMKYNEIVQHLKIPINSIKSRVRRAKLLLKPKLEYVRICN